MPAENRRIEPFRLFVGWNSLPDSILNPHREDWESRNRFVLETLIRASLWPESQRIVRYGDTYRTVVRYRVLLHSKDSQGDGPDGLDIGYAECSVEYGNSFVDAIVDEICVESDAKIVLEKTP